MKNCRAIVERSLAYESDVLCCTILESCQATLNEFRFSSILISEVTQVNEPISYIPIIHYPTRMVFIGDSHEPGPHLSKIIQQLHPECSQNIFHRLLKNEVANIKLK